jgi:mycothiol synthase
MAPIVPDNSGAHYGGIGQAVPVTADLDATPTFRQLTADDVDAIVDLNLLCDIAEAGQPDYEVISWIRDGVGDYRAYGFGDEQGLIACGWLDPDEHGHVGFEGDVRVRPGIEMSVADGLLDRIRRDAVEIDPNRPLHYFANASADRARAWVESHGAHVIRHFWRMQIDFRGAAPIEPLVPEGVVVRRVRADDEADLREVFRVVDTSFEDHFGHAPGRTYEKWIAQINKRADRDFTLWWVAEIDGRMVAALLGWRMPHADHQWIGHVGTLGTLREARGRGIGTCLLRTAFGEFVNRGFPLATLGVDAANPSGAVRLYESAGMHTALEWVLYEFPPL